MSHLHPHRASGSIHLVGLTALCVLLSLLWTATATAGGGGGGAKVGADDLAPIKTVERIFEDVEAPDDAGGYTAACPGDGRAMGGGVYFASSTGPVTTDAVYVSGSSITAGNDGWYGAGSNADAPTRDLIVSTRCLPVTKRRGGRVGADDLAPFRTVERVIEDVQPGQRAGGYTEPCPNGGRAITGGAYFAVPGFGPEPTDSAALSGSSITAANDGWYGAGLHYAGAPRDLVITARCLPVTKRRGGKVGADDLARFKPVEQVFGPLSNGSRIGGYTEPCPARSRAITGGSYWGAPGVGPQPGDNAYLSGSSITAADDGWYGSGWQVTGQPRSLVVTARCLPRTPR
ncbi:hypothetical protein HJD18_01885 [Thermoleophilia bacterium SCSIO 60948]|nr:hypothetical protein HJD18_01885 [Thermoleophilia bacterium SCSIO 60948]